MMEVIIKNVVESIALEDITDEMFVGFIDSKGTKGIIKRVRIGSNVGCIRVSNGRENEERAIVWSNEKLFDSKKELIEMYPDCLFFATYNRKELYQWLAE